MKSLSERIFHVILSIKAAAHILNTGMRPDFDTAKKKVLDEVLEDHPIAKMLAS